MNYEKYGRSTASAQYFLQLAGYLGIPVIAWNADNSGLERVSCRPLASAENLWSRSKQLGVITSSGSPIGPADLSEILPDRLPLLSLYNFVMPRYVFLAKSGSIPEL